MCMAKIVPIEELQPAFENAMWNMLRETDANSVSEVIKEWHKTYNCYLLHDSDFNWESVGFKNDEQELMFVLKWS